MSTIINSVTASTPNAFDALRDQVYPNLFTAAGNLTIFCTDADGLGHLLPELGGKTWRCRTCMGAIDKASNLAVIDDKGNLASLLWLASRGCTLDKASDTLIESARTHVKHARITGVFATEEAQIGKLLSGGFRHMCAEIPRAIRVDSRFGSTAEKTRSDIREFHDMLAEAISSYTDEQIGAVIEALTATNANGTAHVIQSAEKLAEINFLRRAIDTCADKNFRAKDILLWKLAAEGKAYCKVKNHAVGNMLELAAEGASVEAMIRCANDMAHQTLSAPKATQLKADDDYVLKMGLENDLPRRFLGFDEIPEKETIWAPSDSLPGSKGKSVAGLGFFGGVEPREEIDRGLARANAHISASISEMSWTRFARMKLASAERIEALIDRGSAAHLSALVTAANKGAENIYKWTSGVGYYFNGGVADAELAREVVAAGGMYDGDNVAVRYSLKWENQLSGSRATDLDAHLIGPMGHVYYDNKRLGNAALDVDANANGDKTKSMRVPVENIRITDHLAPGHYRFIVKNYMQIDPLPNYYYAELAVGGNIYSVNEVATRSSSYTHEVFSFDVGCRGELFNLKVNGHEAALSTSCWGVEVGSWIPVRAICNGPDAWGTDCEALHTFFVLEDVYDQKGIGHGFLDDQLRHELFAHRRSLNAFAKATPIEAVDDPIGALGFSRNGEWGVTLKVTTRAGVELVKITSLD